MSPASRQTIADTLMITAIFAIPWHAVIIARDVIIAGEKWQYGTIGVYLGDGILCVSLCVALIVYHAQLRSVWNKRDFLAYGMVIAWCTLTALWSPDPLLTLASTARIALCGGMVFVLGALPHLSRAAIFAFICAVMLQALCGIWQFITQSSLPASALSGISAHDVVWGGSATVTTDTGRWLRAYGATPHPNILAGIIAVAICFIVGLLPERRALVRGALHGTFAIALFALLCTGSRGAFIALVAGLATLYIARRKNPRASRSDSLLVCATATAIILLFIGAYGDIIHARGTQTTLSHNAVTDRAQYLRHAAALIAVHPVHGIGVGAATLAAHASLTPTAPIWQAQPVHNVFVLFFAETGIVGSGLLAYGIWRLSAPLRGRAHTPDIATPVAALVTIGVAGLSDHWPWTAHVGLTTIALVLGLSRAALRDAPRLPTAPTVRSPREARQSRATFAHS